MSKVAWAADTANYIVASATTGSLAAVTWFTTFSEWVKVGSGLAAMGMFAITVYKLFKEQKQKPKS